MPRSLNLFRLRPQREPAANENAKPSGGDAARPPAGSGAELDFRAADLINRARNRGSIIFVELSPAGAAAPKQGILASLIGRLLRP